MDQSASRGQGGDGQERGNRGNDDGRDTGDGDDSDLGVPFSIMQIPALAPFAKRGVSSDPEPDQSGGLLQRGEFSKEIDEVLGKTEGELQQQLQPLLASTDEDRGQGNLNCSTSSDVDMLEDSEAGNEQRSQRLNSSGAPFTQVTPQLYKAPTGLSLRTFKTMSDLSPARPAPPPGPPPAPGPPQPSRPAPVLALPNGQNTRHLIKQEGGEKEKTKRYGTFAYMPCVKRLGLILLFILMLVSSSSANPEKPTPKPSVGLPPLDGPPKLSPLGGGSLGEGSSKGGDKYHPWVTRRERGVPEHRRHRAASFMFNRIKDAHFNAPVYTFSRKLDMSAFIESRNVMSQLMMRYAEHCLRLQARSRFPHVKVIGADTRKFRWEPDKDKYCLKNAGGLPRRGTVYDSTENPLKTIVSPANPMELEMAFALAKDLNLSSFAVYYFIDIHSNLRSGEAGRPVSFDHDVIYDMIVANQSRKFVFWKDAKEFLESDRIVWAFVRVDGKYRLTMMTPESMEKVNLMCAVYNIKERSALRSIREARRKIAHTCGDTIGHLANFIASSDAALRASLPAKTLASKLARIEDMMEFSKRFTRDILSSPLTQGFNISEFSRSKRDLTKSESKEAGKLPFSSPGTHTLLIPKTLSDKESQMMASFTPNEDLGADSVGPVRGVFKSESNSGAAPTRSPVHHFQEQMYSEGKKSWPSESPIYLGPVGEASNLSPDTYDLEYSPNSGYRLRATSSKDPRSIRLSAGVPAPTSPDGKDTSNKRTDQRLETPLLLSPQLKPGQAAFVEGVSVPRGPLATAAGFTPSWATRKLNPNLLPTIGYNFYNQRSFPGKMSFSVPSRQRFFNSLQASAPSSFSSSVNVYSRPPLMDSRDDGTSTSKSGGTIFYTTSTKGNLNTSPASTSSTPPSTIPSTQSTVGRKSSTKGSEVNVSFKSKVHDDRVKDKLFKDTLNSRVWHFNYPKSEPFSNPVQSLHSYADGTVKQESRPLYLEECAWDESHCIPDPDEELGGKDIFSEINFIIKDHSLSLAEITQTLLDNYNPIFGWFAKLFNFNAESPAYDRRFLAIERGSLFLAKQMQLLTRFVKVTRNQLSSIKAVNDFREVSTSLVFAQMHASISLRTRLQTFRDAKTYRSVGTVSNPLLTDEDIREVRQHLRSEGWTNSLDIGIIRTQIEETENETTLIYHVPILTGVEKATILEIVPVSIPWHISYMSLRIDKWGMPPYLLIYGVYYAELTVTEARDCIELNICTTANPFMHSSYAPSCASNLFFIELSSLYGLYGWEDHSLRVDAQLALSYNRPTTTDLITLCNPTALDALARRNVPEALRLVPPTFIMKKARIFFHTEKVLETRLFCLKSKEHSKAHNETADFDKYQGEASCKIPPRCALYAGDKSDFKYEFIIRPPGVPFDSGQLDDAHLYNIKALYLDAKYDDSFHIPTHVDHDIGFEMTNFTDILFDKKSNISLTNILSSYKWEWSWWHVLYGVIALLILPCCLKIIFYTIKIAIPLLRGANFLTGFWTSLLPWSRRGRSRRRRGSCDTPFTLREGKARRRPRSKSQRESESDNASSYVFQTRDLEGDRHRASIIRTPFVIRTSSCARMDEG